MIHHNFKKYFFLVLAVFFLNSCKVNLDGDVYIGDIIDVAETGEKLFNPMDISFEMSSVDSCEEDKTKLKTILGLKQTEVEEKSKTLHESINSKLDELVESDKEFKTKADMVRKEISEMNYSKYNLYRLEDLLDGLS